MTVSAEHDVWPVPHQAVLGRRDGVLAHLEDKVSRAALGAVVRLPFGAQAALVGGLARIARRVDRRHTDAARRFLRQAFPEEGGRELEARVLQAWRHFFTVVLESEGFERHVPAGRALEHFDVELCDDVVRVARSGSGSVFVTAHLGNWEAAAVLAPLIGFAPLYVISRPPDNLPMSRRFQAVREARGFRLLPRRGGMKDVQHILEAGGSVAMMLDQRARNRAVTAPFFGRPAACDRSAGVLIKRMKKPVILGACYRTTTPWRWRGVIPTVLWPEDFAGASPEAIATRINAEIEALIRRAPDQYFWLHDRSRAAPAADEPAVGVEAAAG
jgi:KDO2-lipid IV(A) lauroyltransferase